MFAGVVAECVGTENGMVIPPMRQTIEPTREMNRAHDHHTRQKRGERAKHLHPHSPHWTATQLWAIRFHGNSTRIAHHVFTASENKHLHRTGKDTIFRLT